MADGLVDNDVDRQPSWGWQVGRWLAVAVALFLIDGRAEAAPGCADDYPGCERSLITGCCVPKSPAEPQKPDKKPDKKPSKSVDRRPGVDSNVGKPGEACRPDRSCNQGARCLGDRCEAVGSDGERCRADGHCNGDLMCVEGVCRVPGQVGDRCSSQRPCATALTCDEGSGTCRVPATSWDDVCGPSQPCSDGSQCVDGLCQPDASSSSTPADCVDDGACEAGERCDITRGVCVAEDLRSKGAVGASSSKPRGRGLMIAGGVVTGVGVATGLAIAITGGTTVWDRGKSLFVVPETRDDGRERLRQGRAMVIAGSTVAGVSLVAGVSMLVAGGVWGKRSKRSAVQGGVAWRPGGAVATVGGRF